MQGCWVSEREGLNSKWNNYRAEPSCKTIFKRTRGKPEGRTMRNYWRFVAFVGCLFLYVTDGISCKLVGLLLHISMNNPSGRCIVMFKDLPGTLVLVYKLLSTRSVEYKYIRRYHNSGSVSAGSVINRPPKPGSVNSELQIWMRISIVYFVEDWMKFHKKSILQNAVLKSIKI